jgi:iduronate 2-sulfatase
MMSKTNHEPKPVSSHQITPPPVEWRLAHVWILFMSLFGSMLQAKEKPNVLLILVDDLKPIMGCHGDPLAKTPHMD